MKKLLLKKISKSISILFILVICSFLYINYTNEYRNHLGELTELANQLVLSYQENNINKEKVNESLENEYLSKLSMINYMLQKDEKSISNDRLKEIAKNLSVDNISLIDSQGVIIYSSNADNVGIDLKYYPQTIASIRELIMDKNKIYNVDLEREFKEGNNIAYMGLKVNSPSYKIIEIGIDKKNLYKTAEVLKINDIIKAMPTIYDRTIFLVDKQSGELNAISENNSQFLDIANVNEADKQYVNFLNDYTQGGYADINGDKVLLLTRNIGENVLGIYISANLIYKNVLYNILSFIIICGMIFVVIWWIVKKSIEEYALQDINNLSQNIEQLKSGNMNVNFTTKYNTEIKLLSELMEWWRCSYQNKSKRMSHLIKGINKDIGIFECLFDFNQGFYTDTVKEILSIDDELWYKYKSNPYEFKCFLENIALQYKFKDEYIFYKQKYIKLNVFTEENVFYGTIYDKTKEVYQSIEMQMVKAKSEIDLLTDVANRKKLEEYMTQLFGTNRRTGVLLIFDLDNFKQVNDNEGHPVGDKVLKQFADCLKTVFRQQDLIARIGGDEFVIFIENNIDKDLLKCKLDTLLERINLSMKKYNELYSLSTSIGIAYLDKSIKSYDDLYRYADAGLYIAKSLGKNRYYINERKIKCIKSNCTRCKGECVKSELLRLGYSNI